MNSLNNLSTHNSLGQTVKHIEATLQTADKEDLSTGEETLLLLHQKGLDEFRILKYPRPKKDKDAFIVGMESQAGKDCLAVKIHPDCFEPCKRVYGDTDSLHDLIEDGDIPKILSTFHIKGFRVVIYIWQRGINPAYFLRTRNPVAIENMTRALSRRINSIFEKGYTIYLAGTDDFLYRLGEVMILDPNRLLPLHDKDDCPQRHAQRIINYWLE